MKNKENEEELGLLERCIVQLENERPIRELEFEAQEKRRLRSFAFLSEKPLLHIINLSEDRLSETGEILSEELRKDQEITYVCGTLEQQIGEL